MGGSEEKVGAVGTVVRVNSGRGLVTERNPMNLEVN